MRYLHDYSTKWKSFQPERTVLSEWNEASDKPYGIGRMFVLWSLVLIFNGPSATVCLVTYPPKLPPASSPINTNQANDSLCSPVPIQYIIKVIMYIYLLFDISLIVNSLLDLSSVLSWWYPHVYIFFIGNSINSTFDTVRILRAFVWKKLLYFGQIELNL